MKGRFLHDGVLWTEPQLCEAFGISRTALREAVKILSAKGIVETRRKRGTMLRNRSEWNLLDPDVIRWLLASEPEATTVALVEALHVLSRAAGSLATNPDRNGSSVCEGALGIKQMGNPFLSALADVAWKALEQGDSPRKDLEITPNKAPV
jgi:biotin operon repressor